MRSLSVIIGKALCLVRRQHKQEFSYLDECPDCVDIWQWERSASSFKVICEKNAELNWGLILGRSYSRS